jgi:hypothetical protein
VGWAAGTADVTMADAARTIPVNTSTGTDDRHCVRRRSSTSG